MSAPRSPSNAAKEVEKLIKTAELPDSFYALNESYKIFPEIERRHLKYDNPFVYEANQLMDLLSSVRVVSDEFEEEDAVGTKVIRFVLTDNKELRFGYEGRPSKKIAAHSQLAKFDGVLAAGNLFFNADNELVMASHQSGDYKPDYASLLIALIELSKLKTIKFNHTIKIQGAESAGLEYSTKTSVTSGEKMLEQLGKLSLLSYSVLKTVKAKADHIDPFSTPPQKNRYFPSPIHKPNNNKEVSLLNRFHNASPQSFGSAAAASSDMSLDAKKRKDSPLNDLDEEAKKTAFSPSKKQNRN